MNWALAIAILSLVVSAAGVWFNRRAINDEAQARKQEAADRREELDLLHTEVRRVAEREARDLAGAATLICDELLRAAVLADRYFVRGGSIQRLQTGLSRDAWLKHRAELAGPFHNNPIWREMQEMQAALDVTVAHGAEPPSGDKLRGLVARFDHEVKQAGLGTNGH